MALPNEFQSSEQFRFDSAFTICPRETFDLFTVIDDECGAGGTYYTCEYDGKTYEVYMDDIGLDYCGDNRIGVRELGG